MIIPQTEKKGMALSNIQSTVIAMFSALMVVLNATYVLMALLRPGTRNSYIGYRIPVAFEGEDSWRRVQRSAVPNRAAAIVLYAVLAGFSYDNAIGHHGGSWPLMIAGVLGDTFLLVGGHIYITRAVRRGHAR